MVKKIAFSASALTLSIALVLLTERSSGPQPPFPSFDNPLLFLGSFFVQPLYCYELALCYRFNSLSVLVILINLLFFSYVVLGPFTLRLPLVSHIKITYAIGLLLNCGNFVLYVIRSV